MKALYEFYWDCGRSGDLQGLFVADKADVEKAIGRHCDFGECLGKHSEVTGTLEAKDLTIKSEDQAFIGTLVEIIGDTTISGYNPLEYLYQSSEDDEDEEDEEEDEDEAVEP